MKVDYVMFQTEHTDIERDVAPPMRLASTIPIEAGYARFKYEGIVLYVGLSSFAPEMDIKTFKAIVEKVVEQLEVREG